MLGASLLALGAVVVVAVVALPAAGRLRRNPLAGIRLPSLYASDAAWRVGHRAALLPTAITAVVCVVLALVALAAPGFDVVASVLETAVLAAGVLAATVLASRAAQHHPH